MFQLRHTAVEHTARAGNICWQCSIKLSRRDQSRKLSLVRRLPSNIHSPQEARTQTENNTRIIRYETGVSHGVDPGNASDGEHVIIRRTQVPPRQDIVRRRQAPLQVHINPRPGRGLSRQKVNPVKSSTSTEEFNTVKSNGEDSESISPGTQLDLSHLPPTVTIATNGQYAKIQRQPLPSTNDQLQSPLANDVLIDEIDQPFQTQHPITTGITLDQSQPRTTKPRRLETYKDRISRMRKKTPSYQSDRPVLRRLRVANTRRPTPYHHAPHNSAPSGLGFPRISWHPSISTVHDHPFGSNHRMFSTSIRASQSSVATAIKQDSLPATRLNSSPGAEPPIRAKLEAFQQTLDSSSQEKKVALGLAFSNLGLGPDLTVREDEEDDDADDDALDNRVDEHALTLRGLLQPGDLIEIGTESGVCLGLVTATFAGANVHVKRQVQILLSTGPWIHKYDTKNTSPWFVVKQFADASEYAKLKEYLPNKALPVTMLNRRDSNDWFVPADITAPIIEKMQAFQRTADKIYRSQASRIDSAFELIARPNDPTYMTLADITRIVLTKDKSAKLSQEELYAVHKACSLYNPGFLEDFMHWETQTFEILSRRDAELIFQIKRWVREHNEHNVSLLDAKPDSRNKSVLETFAKEVGPIIAKSRKHRKLLMELHLEPSKDQPPVSTSGISYQIIPGAVISHSTALILKFLELWAGRMQHGMTARSLTALGASIIRCTGLYNLGEKVNRLVALTLLRECGVISPWKQPEDIGGRLSDPLQGDNKHIKELLQGSRMEYEENIFKTDSMAELRHDWEDMPVYCIDSAGTVEVDDGISLEATSTPGTYWLHVHVADPSAFISPDSKTVELAQQQYQSVYLPDRVNRMMPINGLVAEFSLGKGRPVLTVSTKLDMAGVILDRQIRSGYINNVLRVTPQTMYQHLGQQATREASKAKVYIVGRPPDVEDGNGNMEENLSVQAIETLHNIQQLVSAWSKRNDASWNRKWRFSGWNSVPEFRIHHTQYEGSDFTRFRRFVGDPTIVVKASPWEPHQSRLLVPKPEISEIVSTCMILSGYTAAMWCSERGIPAVFRGSMYDSNMDLNSLAAVPSQKATSLPEDVLRAIQYRNTELRMKGFSYSRPVAHQILPLEAYMQVTSPLRRFDDLLNHWQIEAALRAEARLGRPLTTFDSIDYPHSEEMIQQHIARRLIAMQTTVRRTRKAEAHWLNQFLVRGSLLGECADLPELLTLCIVGTGEPFKYEAVIVELSHYMISDTASFTAVTGKEPGVGEVWKVQLSQDMIDSNYPTRLKVVPVERVT